MAEKDMSIDLCSTCASNEYMYPIDIHLEGCALNLDLELDGHIDVENLTIEDGDQFYHYFFDDSSICTHILGERVVKSLALCACVDCLKNSITTDNPHYGDGAYGTINKYIIPNETANPQSIIRAHGLSMLEKRIFRAVVRINKAEFFRKIPKTGGVVRSQPPIDVLLKRNTLIGHNLIDAEVIRIEKWSGEKWEYFGGNF